MERKDSLYQQQLTSSFYDAWGAQEWDRLERSLMDRINFLVHRSLLDEHIKPGDKVLEAGAGPGRFTLELARLGARITVGDLSPVQLELNRERVKAAGVEKHVESWQRLDIVDLKQFASESFDVVACLGSVLCCVLDRAGEAVAELRRVTRPGGLVMLSVTSRLGYLRAAMPMALHIAQDPQQLAAINAAVATGNNFGVATQTLPTHFFSWSELQGLLTSNGLEVVTAATSNFLSAQMPMGGAEEALENPAVKEAFLRWELEACRAPGAIDGGTHIIAVARRK